MWLILRGPGSSGGLAGPAGPPTGFPTCSPATSILATTVSACPHGRPAPRHWTTPETLPLEPTLLVSSRGCGRPDGFPGRSGAERGVDDQQFIAWCHEGLARTGLPGEILIVDSSTDRTARARHWPLGLGPAHAQARPRPRHIDAIPFIRGRYIVMGDADCTYDFREVGLFVEKLQEGYEFVMDLGGSETSSRGPCRSFTST